MLHNVKDPQKFDNEPLYLEVFKPDLGTFVVMDEHDEPIVPPESISESLSNGVWTIHFDGARSRSGVGWGLFSHRVTYFHFHFI